MTPTCSDCAPRYFPTPGWEKCALLVVVASFAVLTTQAASLSRLGIDAEYVLARADRPEPTVSTFAAPTTRVLRVAADPNNLPYSNSRLEGFENRIVALIAHELGATVEYTWTPERRGFFRQALKEGNCDLVAGVPKGSERALTTAPYYKSTYVFLTRADRNLNLTSLNDPRLRDLQIGVPLVPDDSGNGSSKHRLAELGITENVRGYTTQSEYGEEMPLKRIADAVARGEIDVAILWGPLAGYCAKQTQGVFSVMPVAASENETALPVTFDVCFGVSRNEPELRDELNNALAKKRSEIEAILKEYGVPVTDSAQ